jgi:diguanylate cyclase (GGDEF)-like protein/putative nucleotidyltransferase with HDIG domain
VDWRQHSRTSRLYLLTVYLAAIPFAVFCFKADNNFSFQWILFTIISVFVATITVRLPKLSAVISMGDVFIVVVLVKFGAGPALLTYWIDIAIAHSADLFRRHGFNLRGKILLHRWLFNFACCALSTWAMHEVYRNVVRLPFPYAVSSIVALFSAAIAWFFVNTGTLSLALSFALHRSFWAVWREGLVLYLLNFMGSAAAAGLISLFYDQVGSLIFALCIPIAVILYELYHFYIQKYDQAQSHISELNKLYIQTIDALASAVDAKDRYTHGHIRRVQAYAAELATRIGIKDEKQLFAIRAGALLHDIGKIAIPEYILNKPTALTETEYAKMQIHPVVGANMLNTIEFPYPLIPMVKSHHERWDGNGYPDGLKGEDIPLNARILSLVDCYDALTTNRPYRSPMEREQVVQFFKREAGRGYDPQIVQVFIDNLEHIETAGKQVSLGNSDVWGIRETAETPSAAGLRPLERVQPITTYGKALNAQPDIQRELYSVFEFVRADLQCLSPAEIFSFMGRRLERLIEFDGGLFYLADLAQGTVTGVYALGKFSSGLDGLTLMLEQKLTGWVAANNQALCNLPPFPDFLKSDDPRPAFQMSAIAPMNRNDQILGAVSLYRLEQKKFTEEEFRRLEIIASQTATLLSRCGREVADEPPLVDALTGLPNGFQLYLMFDQVIMDAARYEYPLAILSMHLDDIKGVRRKSGHLSGDEAIRAAARHLSSELRDTDLLVRYAAEEFIAVNPKMSRDQAENLKSRLQNELDHFKFAVRAQTQIPLQISIGIAIFPDDGVDLESLLTVAEWRMREDKDLRSAVRRRVRTAPLSS